VSQRLWTFNLDCGKGLRIRYDDRVGRVQHSAHVAGRYDRGAGRVGEDIVAGTAHRKDKPKLPAAGQYPLSQHRHQQHGARSASERQNPGLLGRAPNETSRQWVREARV